MPIALLADRNLLMSSPTNHPNLQLLTPEETADLLRISTEGLRRMRDEKRGPIWTTVESRYRYRLSDIEAYIEARMSSRRADR